MGVRAFSFVLFLSVVSFLSGCKSGSPGTSSSISSDGHGLGLEGSPGFDNWYLNPADLSAFNTSSGGKVGDAPRIMDYLNESLLREDVFTDGFGSDLIAKILRWISSSSGTEDSRSIALKLMFGLDSYIGRPAIGGMPVCRSLNSLGESFGYVLRSAAKDCLLQKAFSLGEPVVRFVKGVPGLKPENIFRSASNADRVIYVKWKKPGEFSYRKLIPDTMRIEISASQKLVPGAYQMKMTSCMSGAVVSASKIEYRPDGSAPGGAYRKEAAEYGEENSIFNGLPQIGGYNFNYVIDASLKPYQGQLAFAPDSERHLMVMSHIVSGSQDTLDFVSKLKFAPANAAFAGSSEEKFRFYQQTALVKDHGQPDEYRSLEKLVFNADITDLSNLSLKTGRVLTYDSGTESFITGDALAGDVLQELSSRDNPPTVWLSKFNYNGDRYVNNARTESLIRQVDGQMDRETAEAMKKLFDSQALDANDLKSLSAFNQRFGISGVGDELAVPNPQMEFILPAGHSCSAEGANYVVEINLEERAAQGALRSCAVSQSESPFICEMNSDIAKAQAWVRTPSTCLTIHQDLTE